MKRQLPALLVAGVLFVKPVLVLPGLVLAGDGQGLANVTMDRTDGSEEEASLANDPLTLEAVLAYAEAHSPALRAAHSRLQAARQVPAQVSAYDDPMAMWDNWNAPENLRIDQAGHNIFRLSQKIPFPGKLRLTGGCQLQGWRLGAGPVCRLHESTCMQRRAVAHPLQS